MITVYAHGSLRSCGGPWKVYAPHAVAACRLIAAQVPEFDMALRSGAFRVRIGPMGKGGRTMRSGFERMYIGKHNEIHLTPRAEMGIGGKHGGGLTKIIMGVALLGVGLTGGLLAPAGFAAGLALGGTQIVSFGALALTGASMILTGAASLLAGSPQVAHYESREAPEDRPSFLFSGAVNTYSEGQALTWVWGRDVYVGSSVISAGIIDEQIGTAQQTVTHGMIVDFYPTASGDVLAGKGKKAKYSPPEIKPDTLQSNSLANITDLIGEGELELYDGLKSIYLDNTAIQNFDGTINFTGILVDWRSGTADQDPIKGVKDVQIYQDVGGTATFSTPIIATITDENTTGARVSVRFPKGLLMVEKDGDVGPTTVKFKIEHRSFGGAWKLDREVTVSGKAAAGYTVSYRIDLEADGNPWDVRLTRVSPDPDTKTTNEIQFASLTRLIDAKLKYPYSAICNLRIDAKAFGDDIPRRTYRVKRVDGLIPSNYDPARRTYNGFWNGSFKRGCTDNPAWGLRDLMTSSRYGCGEDILEDYVDDAALYSIAQYCDGNVPNGDGGSEPRYRFNGALSSREDAFQVLTAMAATFRAMIYWGPGAVVAVQNKPTAVRQIVTPSNTLRGGIKYEGTGMRERFSIVKVTWNDPEKLGGTSVTYAMDQAAIRKYGRREKDIYAWGAPSEGQAYRMGKWEIDVSQYSTRIASWGAALKMADLMPGDVVSMADPTISGHTEMGGKVLSYDLNASTITLDRVVNWDPDQEYTIQMSGIDNTLISRALVNPGVPTNTVTLVDPLSRKPVRGSDYVLIATNLYPQQFQILANANTSKSEYGLTALKYDATSFARVERDIILPPRPVSDLPSLVPLPVTNLTIVEYLFQAGTTPQWAALIGWEAQDRLSQRGFEVQYMRVDSGDDTWRPLGDPSFALTRTLTPYAPGLYEFRVRAFSRVGIRSAWTTKQISLLGQQSALPNVTNFAGSIMGGFLTLRWSLVNDLRNPPYQIRFSPQTVGATWGTMSSLVEGVSSSQVVVPAQAGTYAIKAKTFYTESTEAIYVIIEDVPGNYNVVETMEEHPAWAGTRTNMALDGATLVYEPYTTGDGIYQVAAPLDLTEVYSSRVTVSFAALPFDTADVMANWATLAEVAILSGVGPADWSLSLEVRTTQDDPAGSAVWTDWAPVIQGEYLARGLDFRLTAHTNKNSIQIDITEMTITVDMQDRFVTGEDITSSVSGTTISYDPPFKVEPRVFITAQDMETGDYWRITSKTNESAVVTFYDSSDAAVVRTFDFIAAGYGRRIA